MTTNPTHRIDFDLIRAERAPDSIGAHLDGLIAAMHGPDLDDIAWADAARDLVLTIRRGLNPFTTAARPDRQRRIDEVHLLIAEVAVRSAGMSFLDGHLRDGAFIPDLPAIAGPAFHFLHPAEAARLARPHRFVA